MFINKTTAKILQLFTAKMTEIFTLREISRRLGMQVSLVHRSLQPLLNFDIVKQDKHKHLYLNYKKHHETLAFAEYLRRDNFLDKFSDIKLFTEEVISKIREDSFVLLVFGSAVESDKPRDIDILLIIDSTEKIEFHEKFLSNIASGYEIPIEERVIAFESVYEMLSNREENNVMNEILNKHIILYGAELFYRLISKGR